MNEPMKLPCGVCGHLHYYGPGQYGLRKAEGYHLWVCTSCWDGNWDGWNPRHEVGILQHLQREGLPIPPRLANGLLPREWRG